MKPIATIALAFALVAGAAGPAAATTYLCTSRIADIGTDNGGTVTMRFADYGENFYLCGTVSPVSGITTENCKVWMSQLLAAWAMGRTATLWFDTENSNNATMTGCDAASFNWNTRPPYFVMVRPS